MSAMMTTIQESSFTERKVTSGQPFIKSQIQAISYTAEPTILREDFAVKRVERPEAYQFWHKKDKYGSYSSRVLNTNYRSASVINPGQTFQINNIGTGPAQSQIVSNTNQNDYQCCTKQQVMVSVVVASREELERPWREECLYLQQIIKELEKRKEVQVIKEIDYDRIAQLEAENAQLEIELQQAQETTVITNRVSDKSAAEIEIWKKKFQEINHDFNEAQEQLMNVEIEIEALKKQQQAVVTTTTSKVVRSSTRTGTSSIVKQA